MRTSVAIAVGVLAWIALTAAPASAVEDGREPGWVGLTFGNPLGPHPASVVNDDREPLLVGRVVVSGPADEAGVRARDSILAFDGQGIEHSRELIDLVRAHEPGAWATLTIKRGRAVRDLRIQIGARPLERERRALRRAHMGVESISLPASLQQHFGGSEKAGVLVSAVAEGSPAETAGVRVGDLLVTIGGQDVASQHQLAILVAGAGVGNKLECELVRNGVPIVVEPIMQERMNRETR
ncbi:MAG: PDZ domain-containing protein [Acidobacteriota bacterium]|nr:PDZ domain-containing protein [Acidobacteriota bacterium]MDH3784021.1 PDZ domain-containing protein [Acidobacteriota bacterium]